MQCFLRSKGDIGRVCSVLESLFSLWINKKCSFLILLNMLFVLKALGSFSAVFGEEWKEKTDRDFVKVIQKLLK